MLTKYRIAIETINWLMLQSQSKDLFTVEQSTLEELYQLKLRLNYLFDEKTIEKLKQARLLS